MKQLMKIELLTNVDQGWSSKYISLQIKDQGCLINTFSKTSNNMVIKHHEIAKPCASNHQFISLT
jgi:hypothetical protein